MTPNTRDGSIISDFQEFGMILRRGQIGDALSGKRHTYQDKVEAAQSSST